MKNNIQQRRINEEQRMTMSNGRWQRTETNEVERMKAVGSNDFETTTVGSNSWEITTVGSRGLENGG